MGAVFAANKVNNNNNSEVLLGAIIHRSDAIKRMFSYGGRRMSLTHNLYYCISPAIII